LAAADYRSTLKSDSNPSLLKCVEDHARSLLTYLERIKKSDGFKIFLVSTGSLILIAESPNFFRRREEELKVFITCQGLILYFLGEMRKLLLLDKLPLFLYPIIQQHIHRLFCRALFNKSKNII